MCCGNAKGYDLYEAVVMAGKTRLTPVILTATAAILGLIPLAIGLTLTSLLCSLILSRTFLLAAKARYSGAHWPGQLFLAWVLLHFLRCW